MKLLSALLLLLSFSFAQSLHIAAASSLRGPLEEIGKLFSQKHPDVKLYFSYGASGNLYRQILGGAPYDLFLSASELYTNKLYEKGEAGKPVPFARGRLVIFSRNLDVRGPEVLRGADRIAMANPRYAPYGVAALEFLKKVGLYEEVRRKLLQGTNVAQAFQFVVSGGAEVGIVSLSLAVGYGKGSYWVVPEDMHSPIRHVAVITERGMNNKMAESFLRFLTSPKAGEVLKRYGFGVP